MTIGERIAFGLLGIAIVLIGLWGVGWGFTETADRLGDHDTAIHREHRSAP